MAEIFYDQIASTKEFEDQLQSLMKVIVGLKNEMKESAKEMLSEMRNLSEQGMGELTKKASTLSSAYNKLTEEEKKLEKETKEIAKAQESLARQKQQGLAMKIGRAHV